MHANSKQGHVTFFTFALVVPGSTCLMTCVFWVLHLWLSNAKFLGGKCQWEDSEGHIVNRLNTNHFIKSNYNIVLGTKI